MLDWSKVSPCAIFLTTSEEKKLSLPNKEIFINYLNGEIYPNGDFIKKIKFESTLMIIILMSKIAGKFYSFFINYIK